MTIEVGFGGLRITESASYNNIVKIVGPFGVLALIA